MFKVREPLGNRARIGTQGYLVSMAMMLTAWYPPSVTSIYVETHTAQLQQGAGDMGWKPEPYSVGEGSCHRCEVGKMCLWAA